MRFKKLRVSLMVALALFFLLVVSIASLSFAQKTVPVSSSSLPGDNLIAPIVKNETLIVQVPSSPSKISPSVVSSPTPVSKPVSVPPLKKKVVTRAS